MIDECDLRKDWDEMGRLLESNIVAAKIEIGMSMDSKSKAYYKGMVDGLRFAKRLLDDYSPFNIPFI